MSNTRRATGKPLIVVSQKKLRVERKLANEAGVQKAKYIRELQEKAAEAIASSNALRAKGAALREAAIAAGNSQKPVPVVGIDAGEEVTGVSVDGSTFTRETFYMLACLECGDIDKPLAMPFKSQEARGKWASEHTAGTGHDRWRVTTETRKIQSEPVLSEWIAEDDGWFTEKTQWKNAIYRTKDGQKIDRMNCPHKHKTPDAARACALKAVRVRNDSNRPPTDGWAPAEKLEWSVDEVRALVSEITSKG